jgi:hypothetical protein
MRFSPLTGGGLSMKEALPMELTERALSDLLVSPYGKNCGESILEAIERGEAYTIKMTDGSTLSLVDRATAVLMLSQLFGWTMVAPPAP